MEQVLIITGGSKGIGRGIIAAYLEKDVRVFSLSRSIDPALSAEGVTQIAIDLIDTPQIDVELQKIFALLDATEISKITLINNAGMLGQIGPLHQLDAAGMAQTIQLNVTAPFVASAFFVRTTAGWQAKKSIINISSGAALKPYFGWSVYCSSKAAINMLSQNLALEQNDVPNGVKVLAIAPGVVDTEMQQQIRQSNKTDFRDIDRFMALKADGELNDSITVGKKIWEMDNNDNLENGAILRVEGK